MPPYKMNIYILFFKKDLRDIPRIHAAYMFKEAAQSKETEIKDKYYSTWIEETICYGNRRS
jgi:hypothetical protein